MTILRLETKGTTLKNIKKESLFSKGSLLLKGFHSKEGIKLDTSK